MKLAREETKSEVTSRSFYHKYNLKLKGRNRNRGKFGTQNRILDKRHGSATLLSSSFTWDMYLPVKNENTASLYDGK
jgi:hypothetical protein